MTIWYIIWSIVRTSATREVGLGWVPLPEGGTPVTTIASTVEAPGAEYAVDPAELAAVAFLARYSGRTLDAYRHDLRNLFQWAADHSLPVLEASRVTCWHPTGS
jgi:hypothetical protein